MGATGAGPKAATWSCHSLDGPPNCVKSAIFSESRETSAYQLSLNICWRKCYLLNVLSKYSVSTPLYGRIAFDQYSSTAVQLISVALSACRFPDSVDLAQRLNSINNSRYHPRGLVDFFSVWMNDVRYLPRTGGVKFSVRGSGQV